MRFSARLETWILSRLLNAITVRDIVTNDPKTGEVLINGAKASPSELTTIQAEIKAMEGFTIWRLMSETTKHHAEERIFNKSVSMDDIRYGKAMLYSLSLQKSIMDALRAKLR